MSDSTIEISAENPEIPVESSESAIIVEDKAPKPKKVKKAVTVEKATQLENARKKSSENAKKRMQEHDQIKLKVQDFENVMKRYNDELELVKSQNTILQREAAELQRLKQHQDRLIASLQQTEHIDGLRNDMNDFKSQTAIREPGQRRIKWYINKKDIK